MHVTIYKVRGASSGTAAFQALKPAFVLFTVILIISASLFPAPAASAQGESAVAPGALKAALDSALSEADASKRAALIKKAFSALDSAEAGLASFEIFFLMQDRRESERSFAEFDAAIDACRDEYVKSYYSQLAPLYATFVNQALGREALSAKDRAVRPGGGIAILAVLAAKYRAAFDAIRKDSQDRRSSSDFISYLEKKCGGPSASAAAAGDTAYAQETAEAFKKAGAEARLMRVLGRRYLLSLMIYKNVAAAGEEKQKKAAADIVKKIMPEKIYRDYFPADISE